MLTTIKLGILPFEHKVLMIHGIRDDGAWFDDIEEELHGANLLLKTSRGGYGYMHVFWFIIPLLRRRKYNKILQTLRDSQGHLCAVSVICHSFGTYCVTKAIRENNDVKVFRLIMCGGIVHRDFEWRKVPCALPKGRVVNDCGNNDFWPIIANRLSRQFGQTGRFGFGRDPVTDRWHNVNHGGFFDKEIVSRFWVPFLKTGAIEKSKIKQIEPKWYLRILAGRFP